MKSLWVAFIARSEVKAGKIKMMHMIQENSPSPILPGGTTSIDVLHK